MYEPKTLVPAVMLPVSSVVLLLLLPCCSNVNEHDKLSKTVHAIVFYHERNAKTRLSILVLLLICYTTMPMLDV